MSVALRSTCDNSDAARGSYSDRELADRWNAWGYGTSPPSDTHLYPTRKYLDGDPPFEVVGQADAELLLGVAVVDR